MIRIDNIKDYWMIHRWRETGLLDVEKMSSKIERLYEIRATAGRNQRKLLSDKLVALEHDRARLQGKTDKMSKALATYEQQTGINKQERFCGLFPLPKELWIMAALLLLIFGAAIFGLWH